MKESKKVEVVVGKATRLDGTGALVVTIDPQYANWSQNVWDEIVRIVGHKKVALFALPENALKFYSVKTRPEDIIIQGVTGITGDLKTEEIE